MLELHNFQFPPQKTFSNHPKTMEKCQENSRFDWIGIAVILIKCWIDGQHQSFSTFIFMIQ